MRLSLLPGLLVIFCALNLIFGCSQKKSASGKEVFDYLASGDISYRTNTAQKAYSQLLVNREDLLNKRREGVKGIDYDVVLAIVNGRLFVLSEHLGNSNQADIFFVESAACFASVRRTSRMEPIKYTREKIRDLIDTYDATGKVMWRELQKSKTNK